MTVVVDRHVAYHGTTFVTPEVTPLKAVQAAYNHAAKAVMEAGRTPVMIEVIVRVAPQ